MKNSDLTSYFKVDKELVIIFSLVAITGIIFFLVPNQGAFLNFFYIPVLIAAYFFGKHYATNSAVLSIILVSLIAYFYPSVLSSNLPDQTHLWLDIVTWGSFLIITAYLMGHLYEKKESANTEIKKTYQGIIEMMSLIIDSADKASQSHSYRVSVIAGMIAREMGLPEVWVENVRIAALLHDLGKLGVSNEVLKKIDKMTCKEAEQIDIRSMQGADSLEPVCGKIFDILPSIIYFSEKFDGSGDFKMVGDDIPIGARIIAVADYYDSITSEPSRNKDLSPLEVKQEIMERTRAHFDPGVVKAFTSVFQQLSAEIPGK